MTEFKQKWHGFLARIWSFKWLGWDLWMETDLLKFAAAFDIHNECLNGMKSAEKKCWTSITWISLEQTCLFSLFFSPSLQIMLQLDGYNPKHSSLVCYQLNERRTSHSFSFVVVFVFPWQYFSILEPEFVVFGGPELHLHHLEQVCCKDNPPLRKLYLRGWSCYSHKQGPNDN